MASSSADRDMKEVVVSPQPPPYESPAPDPRGQSAPEPLHPAHAASSASATYQQPDYKHGGVSPQITGASAFQGDRGPVSPQSTGAGAPHDPSSFGHPQQPPPAAQYPSAQPTNSYSQPIQPAPAQSYSSQPQQHQQQQQQYAQQQQQQYANPSAHQQGHPMQDMKTAQSGPGRQQFRNTVPLQTLTSAPAPVQCPACGAVALTHTDIQTGMFTHAIALAVCVFTCLGCIPYCISGFKDVEHKCGNCGVRLAMWHRSGRTEVLMYN